MSCKFSEQEIGDALFQIGPLKSLGPDGLPARFYQQSWVILKTEIVAVVRCFFSTGIMPHGVSEALIFLIPKINQSESMKDF